MYCWGLGQLLPWGIEILGGSPPVIVIMKKAVGFGFAFYTVWHNV